MTDDLLTRMRTAASLGAAIRALDEGADEIERLRHDLDRLMEREAGHVQEIEELRARLHDVQEIYAGMEGFQPMTAAEGYVLRICKQMYDAALGERHE